MSTLPARSTVSLPPTSFYQLPEERYRLLLLYIEALIMLVLLGLLVSFLGSRYPTSSNIQPDFGVLFGTSAVTLLGSIRSAARARPHVVKIFRLSFHVAILAELCRAAYVVLPEGSFSNVLSRDALGPVLVFPLAISFIHAVLYLIHTNMVQAAEGNIKSGLFVLDDVCRWIRRGASAVRSLRRSQGGASPGSVALEHIGKFKVWLLVAMINTQHQPQVRASGPDETIPLLGDNVEKLV